MQQRRWPRVLFATVLFLVIACSAGWAQTFSVSATPQILTIHPGDQNVPLTVSVSASSYAGPISITLTGLPSGITVAPLTLNAGGSGTLNISASVSADTEAFPANSPTNPNSVSNTVEVVGVAGSTVVSSPMTLIVSLSNPSFAPAASDINLPIVTIDTSGTPVTSKTVDVPGTITITSADGQTSYLPNASDSDNSATFHVHGNTTALMPKLAYEFKLGTSLDLLNTMGLSCPYVTSSGKKTCDKSKTYVLLANYDDKTFLRDWAASALANAIPIGNGYLNSPADSPTPSGTSTLMPWAPHSLFVELYLNGVYEGNYQLIEKVNVDSHRINITELAETDITDDITGGYLLEIDQHQDEAYVFHTPVWNVPIGLIDPDFSPDPEVPQQTSYISNYVDSAETALDASNFTDPTLGWRAYFDEASAVNFYIVNDVMGNADGGSFFSSDYLYKAQDNPLLYMGPIWDFDISSGNDNENPIESATVPWMQTQAIWYTRLFQDPGFKADVATQWNALKNNGVFTTWLASINQEAATLQQSQANNFGRWPMQGIEVWPNPEAVGSYNGEVSYLTNWINLRIAYLDSLFNGKAQTSTTMSISNATVQAGSPTTLTAHVTGGSNPTGTVTFTLQNGVVESTATLDSGGEAAVAVSNLPVGNDNLYAVYSGDQQNGLSSSALTGITVLPPLVETTTGIASSASSVNAGDYVALTVTVVGTSGTAAPTGTIVFTADGNELGTVSLSENGSATFSTTSLASGSDSVQATYSGDSTYQASSSPTLGISVAPPPPPSFALNIPPIAAVKPGAAAVFNLMVTPLNGFTGPVTLMATGLPPGATVSFNPATVTVAGTSSATTTMKVVTSSAQTRLLPARSPLSGGGSSIRYGLLLLVGIGRLRKRLRALPQTALLAVLVLLSLSAVTAAGLIGCGGGPAPKKYIITVTGTSGNVRNSTTVALTMQ